MKYTVLYRHPSSPDLVYEGFNDPAKCLDLIESLTITNAAFTLGIDRGDLCGCGRPVRYQVSDGRMACNKFFRCR